MKINAQWEVTGRRNDFIVIESHERIDTKSGQAKISTNETFHPTLEQALQKIVRSETLSAVEHQTVEQLMSFLDNLKQELKEAAHAAKVAFQSDSEVTVPADPEGEPALS